MWSGIVISHGFVISDPIEFDFSRTLLFEAYGLEGSEYVQFSFVRVGDKGAR